MLNIHDYDPKLGMAAQGDVLIVPAPAGFSLDQSQEIAPRDAMIILAEGEGFGNFHSVLLEKHPRFFAVEELMADALAGKIAVPTARLFRDDKLLDQMIAKGPLTEIARELCVGFLLIEHGSMLFQHVKADGTSTGEHDAIRVPPGLYYCGRQVESVAGALRRVQD